MVDPTPTYTVWSLAESLVELKPTFKQRVRKGDHTRNAYTLRRDIREWMQECASDHWYLREKRLQSDRGFWGGGATLGSTITSEIFIHFRSQKDAVLFKLTWL